MDAPPGSGEDIAPFVRIARHLLGLGLSAPRILAEDARRGFLLLENLGDGLISRLASDPALEVTLYEAAAEVLVTLARAPCPDGLPVLDAQTASTQIAPFFDWYVAGTGGDVPRTALTEALADALARHGGPADVMIHRDYHAENLLWLPDRPGVAKVGVLDFQLAHRGAAAYDMVSLIEDARRDLGEAAREAAIRVYSSQRGLSEQVLRTAMAVWGAQRNLRILGIFARLSMHLGKPHYIDLMPRVWGHLRSDLAHPALAQMARVALPEPSPAVLERFKALCGTVPNR
jgi:aminoglycoside/choline kinase family phosphotransferase